MIYIFLILGLLYYLEMSTSFMRQVGSSIGRPDAGLQLQSSFSMLSRFFMLLMMPVIGLHADKNTIGFGAYSIYITIPFLIVFTLNLKKTIFIDVYYSLMMSMIKDGSFLKVRFLKYSGKKITKKANYLKLVIFGAYLPYYGAWPLCMLLIDYFPDNRATLLGMTGVVNGINTVILAVYIDPHLIKVGRHLRLTQLIYNNIYKAKLISLFVATMLMVVLSNVVALLL